jgi:HK97 family phage major capsid protein
MSLKEKTTVELRGRLDEVNSKAHEIIKQAGETVDMSKVTCVEGDNAAKLDAFRALQQEASELGTELDQRKEFQAEGARIERSREVQPHPGHGSKTKKDAAEENAPVKSLGELFTESPVYGKVSQGQMGADAEFNVDIEATLFSTGAGWAPPTIRTSRVVDYAVRSLVVADLLPTITVSGPTYLYMEETTFTNTNAKEVAEGSAKGEVALALTERTENIRKIAAYLPVTDEQLDDVPAARAYIDNRLAYMVKQRLDGQILNGDGTAPNIAGITDDSRTGLQTQALGSNAKPDAVYKAMTLIRVNAFSEPNATVFHPNDWQDFRLLRTADGIYIWGNPADAGPERIWGLRVVQTTAETEGTALVGDFNQAALLMRQGLTMKVGYVNDDLIKNRQTIVAELRAGVAVFRPAAFCTVTGL